MPFINTSELVHVNDLVVKIKVGSRTWKQDISRQCYQLRYSTFFKLDPEIDVADMKMDSTFQVNILALMNGLIILDETLCMKNKVSNINWNADRVVTSTSKHVSVTCTIDRIKSEVFINSVVLNLTDLKPLLCELYSKALENESNNVIELERLLEHHKSQKIQFESMITQL